MSILYEFLSPFIFCPFSHHFVQQCRRRLAWGRLNGICFQTIGGDQSNKTGESIILSTEPAGAGRGEWGGVEGESKKGNTQKMGKDIYKKMKKKKKRPPRRNMRRKCIYLHMYFENGEERGQQNRDAARGIEIRRSIKSSDTHRWIRDSPARWKPGFSSLSRTHSFRLFAFSSLIYRGALCWQDCRWSGNMFSQNYASTGVYQHPGGDIFTSK